MRSEEKVAALFVEKDGCYFGLPDVDPWDRERDARNYAGPWPVVAHPPCERWGDFWFGGTHPGSKRYALGDDGGCFASALAAVRRWGGVLEHPEGSRAWKAFNLLEPLKDGSWLAADWLDGHAGWTCRVEQSAYGHKAPKPTWLYACGVDLPRMKHTPPGRERAYLRAMSARRMAERGVTQPLKTIPRKECAATPIEFRDLLLSIARTAQKAEAA